MQNESFEPMFVWGVRMALSGTLPIIWGMATGHIADAVWIALTAEAITWVELKGAFAWRVRTLFSGVALAIIFAILGTLSGNNIWLGVLGMFFTGYVSTLLKHIGDRASGLAICAYLLFIICNAFPVSGDAAFEHRLMLVAIGAAWPVLVGIAMSMFMPSEQPFRRQIAIIWRSIADLVTTVSQQAAKNKEATADMYDREKQIRAAIDSSYEFFSRMAHQADQKNNSQYQLLQLRKAAGLVAVHVVSMGEEMEHIAIPTLDEQLRVKAATLFSAMKEAVSRISVFVATLKPEEKLLAISHINRMRRLSSLISEHPMPDATKQTAAINRILLLTGRTIKLMESALQRVEQMGEDVPVYRSYSFLKTLFVLKPRYFISSLRVLFNYNSFATRFAIRSATAASAALFIGQYFRIDHGYWLPFSVMIVIQPYFGATLRKATDRVTGTALGGIAGGVLMMLPANLHVKEGILFLTFLLMVYYVRRNYALSAFVITLNLVLLFSLEQSYSHMLLLSRALCTIGGSALAVIAGFALLPTWDKKYLPIHLTRAIHSNYSYFIATFFGNEPLATWIRYKRTAESENSNVFDSFNRYMQEPGKEKTEAWHTLITTNIRITRNLTYIHLEQEEKNAGTIEFATPLQQHRITHCYTLFQELNQYLSVQPPPHVLSTEIINPAKTPFLLNEAQSIYLEKLAIELNTMLQEAATLRKQ